MTDDGWVDCCVEGGPIYGHFCSRLKTFIGDPTMGSLEFETEFGNPAPEEAT